MRSDQITRKMTLNIRKDIYEAFDEIHEVAKEDEPGLTKGELFEAILNVWLSFAEENANDFYPEPSIDEIEEESSNLLEELEEARNNGDK